MEALPVALGGEAVQPFPEFLQHASHSYDPFIRPWPPGSFQQRAREAGEGEQAARVTVFTEHAGELAADEAAVAGAGGDEVAYRRIGEPALRRLVGGETG